MRAARARDDGRAPSNRRVSTRSSHLPIRVSSIGAVVRGADSSTTNTPGPDAGTDRPHGTGPSASSPTARRSPGAVPSIALMVQTTERRYRSGPMTSRLSAVRRSRRLVSALLVALLAFTGTVAVVSWPRSTPAPVSAALPTAGGTPPASAPPAAAASPDGRSPEGERSCQPRRRRTRARLPRSSPAVTPPQEEAALAVPEALDRKLQSRLNKLRSKYAIPGVSVTIILADGSTWTGTSGYANVRKKTRVKDDTAFALASVSKTYTSALIMALANEGKLDLDARRVVDPSEDPDRRKGDRSPAARPHERAARLLPQRQDRPGAVW